MKKFLSKILAFFIFSLTTLLLVCSINGYLLQNSIEKSLNVKDTETLILGDSHMELGLNPSKFRSAKNISQSSEPYSISYHKLNTVLQRPNKIKNVLLGFSYHNFDVSQDSITSDVENSNYSTFVRRYTALTYENSDSGIKPSEFYFYNYLVWKLGFPNIKTLTLNFHSISNKNNINELPFIGSFKKYSSISPNESTLIIKNACTRYKNQVNYSKMQLESLKRIKELTKQYNIRLFLVNTPIQKTYKECFNPIYISSIDNLKLNDQNTTILNLSDYSLKDDFFKDPHHLSGNGADYFSELVSNMISL